MCFISVNLFKVITIFVVLVLATSDSQLLERQKVESYTSCRIDADCKPNAFCFGNDDIILGKCKCLNGYQMTNRNSTYYECSKVVKLDEPCEKDIECQILTNLAYCSEHKLCTCQPDAQRYNGQCYNIVNIGDICISDGNCFMNGKSRAFCTDGRCTCRLNERPSSDGTMCLSAASLGEPCVSDEECTVTVPNTRCLGRCVCATGYTLSRDESECVKAAIKFGEPCSWDGQCSLFLKEGICENQRCTCSSGLHEYGDRCVVTKKPGNSCSEDAECIYEKTLNGNINCTNNICVCMYGQKGDGLCNIEKTVDNSSSTTQITFIHIFFILITYCSFMY